MLEGFGEVGHVGGGRDVLVPGLRIIVSKPDERAKVAAVER